MLGETQRHLIAFNAKFDRIKINSIE
jgi:hypothetical protein